MKNHEEEFVARLILFRKDFSDAISYFEKAKLVDDRFVRDALIKMGVISYAKPFMDNKSIHKELKGYRLPAEVVTKKKEWLHQMLMNYRGNFIGHSNFKVIAPIVGTLETTPIGEMIPIQYMDLVFDKWLQGDPDLPEEPPIIEQVIQMVSKLMGMFPRAYEEEEVFQEHENAK